MFDIDQTIRERRSTRMFLPQRPVPRALLLNGLSPWPCSVELQYPAVADVFTTEPARAVLVSS